MDYRELFKQENEDVIERYELAAERIKNIENEDTVKAPFNEYFKFVARFIGKMCRLYENIDKGLIWDYNFSELQNLNHDLYEDIENENYDESFANPEYAVAKLGEDYGALLSFLYVEMRGMITYAYDLRLVDITINMELFIEIYNEFEQETEPLKKNIVDIIYWFVSDNADITLAHRVRENIDPALDRYVRIVTDSDLNDLRYLYKYGCYITENEIKTARFLNKLSQEKIDVIAKTYTEGYRLGFEIAKKPLDKKGTVSIYYNVGFERIVKAAIRNFEALGLKPVILGPNVEAINRQGRSGVVSTEPNKQYKYDHRFDGALFINKAFNERKLGVIKSAYESMKEMASLMAGPAVIEVFGDKPFEPESKTECLALTKEQEKLQSSYTNASSLIVKEYIKGEERSFTIIAFPIPDIGENFEELFEATVKINTLDQDKYRVIQQNIIDTLDKAEHVRVVGNGENKTYINISMHELNNPGEETNFENCLADVNIPLGEVFTSPKLEGTNGVLHVSQVYLGNLKFNDLEITFEDGCIKEYTCSNFDNHEDNKKYIKENVLFNHETLPIGEFAIGTNTTAYAIAKQYDILYKLPILIVEKMGPHFAVGDTCYSWEEDIKTYNPDGKEIIAKDNEKSILRKENPQEAYFNCHTDITIPYNEIGEIVAVTANGEEIPIIRDGRFVLEGTELLNEAISLVD